MLHTRIMMSQPRQPRSRWTGIPLKHNTMFCRLVVPFRSTGQPRSRSRSRCKGNRRDSQTMMSTAERLPERREKIQGCCILVARSRFSSSGRGQRERECLPAAASSTDGRPTDDGSEEPTHSRVRPPPQNLRSRNISLGCVGCWLAIEPTLT